MADGGHLGFTSFVFAQRNGTVSMSVKKRLLLRSFASHYAIIGYWRHFPSTPIGHDPTERTLVTHPTIHGERTVEMLPLGRRVNVTINDVLFNPSVVYIATGTSAGKISIDDFHQSFWKLTRFLFGHVFLRHPLHSISPPHQKFASLIWLWKWKAVLYLYQLIRDVCLWMSIHHYLISSP